MKRTMVLIIPMAIVFLFSMSVNKGQAVNASENNDTKIIFEEKEIKDTNKLLDRAEKGITDNKSLDEIRNREAVIIGSKGEIEVEPYVTSQLIKKEKITENEVQETYATTVFHPITNSDLMATSKSEDKYDDALSVLAYSTFSYELTTKEGQTHVAVTSTNGGWDIKDSGVHLENQRVRIGQSGPTKYESDWGAIQQHQDYYPSGTSFSYSPPSSWVPVVLHFEGSSSAGLTTWTDIVGHGDQWSLSLTNNTAE